MNKYQEQLVGSKSLKKGSVGKGISKFFQGIGGVGLDDQEEEEPKESAQEIMDKLNDAKVLERQNRRLKFSSKISLNADTIGNLYNKEIQYDD